MAIFLAFQNTSLAAFARLYFQIPDLITQPTPVLISEPAFPKRGYPETDCMLKYT
jgi:hypothetical protein